MDKLHLPSSSPAVSGLSENYPAGHTVEWHQHDMGQLIYAISGTMRITVERECWLLPQLWGGWIPAGTSHSISMTNSVKMRTVYVVPSAHSKLPKMCQVINVTPILKTLIHAIAVQEPATLTGQQLRCALLLEELTNAPPAPFILPLGIDRRLQRATDLLLSNPASLISLDELSKEVGASGRTLMRLFKKETGLTFGHWRQRQRLIDALERLTRGEPIGRVASKVGYTSVNAFGAMIRRSTGQTPGALRRKDENLSFSTT